MAEKPANDAAPEKVPLTTWLALAFVAVVIAFTVWAANDFNERQAPIREAYERIERAERRAGQQ